MEFVPNIITMYSCWSSSDQEGTVISRSISKRGELSIIIKRFLTEVQNWYKQGKWGMHMKHLLITLIAHSNISKWIYSIRVSCCQHDFVKYSIRDIGFYFTLRGQNKSGIICTPCTMILQPWINVSHSLQLETLIEVINECAHVANASYPYQSY